MHAFSRAQFLRAAGRPADLPPARTAEVAFAGRSNVGKSSAINALTGRRRLAHTSKTPGRTQTINFYALGDAAHLVDLPGYGYARVPRELRSEWRSLVDAYLKSRKSLAAVVVVMDARHPLTALDEQLLEWLGDVPALALLSKADKLSRREQAAVLKSTRLRLGERRATTRAQLFSSVTRQGVDEARALLELWLQDAEIKGPR